MPSYTLTVNGKSRRIEAEATGTTTWPRAQMDAYARLCAALCEHYSIPVSRVLGHKEVAVPKGRKIDPNFDMAVFRRAVEAANQEDDMTDSDRKILERIEAKLDALTTNEAARYKVYTGRYQEIRGYVLAVRDKLTGAK